MHGPAYTPPACTSTSPLTDLACGHPWAAWIMRARAKNLVNDCAAGRYCPDDIVTRLELKQLLGNSF